jgi:hypothetical protein
MFATLLQIVFHVKPITTVVSVLRLMFAKFVKQWILKRNANCCPIASGVAKALAASRQGRSVHAAKI